MINDTREDFVKVQLKAIEAANDFLQLSKRLAPDEEYNGYTITFDAIDGDDYGKEDDRGRFYEREVVSWRVEISLSYDGVVRGRVKGVEEHSHHVVHVNGERMFIGGYSETMHWIEDKYGTDIQGFEIEIIEEHKSIYGLLDKLGGNTDENTIFKTGELR